MPAPANRLQTLRHPAPTLWLSVRRLLTLAMLASLPSVSAIAQNNGLTPEQVARLRSVTSAKLSPNGQHIAYTLSVPRDPLREENGSAWAELHVIETGTGSSRPYITGKVNVGAVAWTSDGKAISFLAKRRDDKFRSLHVIPLAGGEAHRVLSHGANITAYSWSPDGKRIAFLATEPDPDEKNKKKRVEQGFDQKIFEEEDRFVRVWVAEPANSEGEPRMLDLEGNASELHWSPTDNRLAVALSPTPFIDDHYLRRKVHVVDADTGKVLARIDHTAKLGQVAWSPGGKNLALLTGADINDPIAGRLMVIPSTGGTLRNLLPEFEGAITATAWVTETTIACLAARGVTTYAGAVPIDEKEPSFYPLEGGPVLTSFSRARDNGRVTAFVGHNRDHPAEVFLMSSGDKEPRRLTRSNPLLEDVRLGEQTTIRYKARDGLEVEGLLIKPLGYEEGKRYPLITVVHGGPESHYSNGWLTSYSLPGQMAAARGFAVFYPNYRGSTGRGIPYAKADHKDPAGKEFDDLIDGIDHLIATGIADKDRVGVTGGSYGGYATGWLSTFYSDRIAAGVMFVGISNQVSKWGVTDIPQEVIESHFEMKPYENWLLFLKRSPVYHADKSRTPLLILHGTKDTRVPTFQSLEMYRHLKVRGKAPVRLVLYPGEPHGNRKAAARYDYNLRMLRWFEHYLQGPGGAPPSYKIGYEQTQD